MTYAIWWIRRDLRIEDNAALFHALRSGLKVIPLFIFDTTILDRLVQKRDMRVEFIHDALTNLQVQCEQQGSTLLVKHGNPQDVYKQLLQEYDFSEVYTNHDYEPYARKRDEAIVTLLAKHHVKCFTYKDQVVFEKDEILNKQGKPYTVFTPYSKAWRARLDREELPYFDSKGHVDALWSSKPVSLPSLEQLGFERTQKTFPERKIPVEVVKNYDKTRDVPSIHGTSRLGVHLRFGTLSVRKLVAIAKDLNDGYLNELIWREFYMQILWHFPYVVDGPFRKEYEAIAWRNNEEEFEKWCLGQTGFPIVDAGMRELNETGYMHNRVRMIVASFLTKDLLIDWRWGEKYFAEKLLDFELASNNGGWQWAAGTGTDAAPYFRIFNPDSQQQKFDPNRTYIKRWVPEVDTQDYPAPMVDHKRARLRCLDAYKQAKDTTSH